jgi:hypothetical protein
MELSRQEAATQVNLDAFCDQLEREYVRLFECDPEYAYSAARITPAALARKMTLGLDSGSANKDGDGIKRTCKHFGIPYTYKAIRAFLTAR